MCLSLSAVLLLTMVLTLPEVFILDHKVVCQYLDHSAYVTHKHLDSEPLHLHTKLKRYYEQSKDFQ